MKIPPGVQIKVKIKEKLQTARTQKGMNKKKKKKKKKRKNQENEKTEDDKKKGEGAKKKMRAAEEIKGNIFEWCFMLQKSKKAKKTFTFIFIRFIVCISITGEYPLVFV